MSADDEMVVISTLPAGLAFAIGSFGKVGQRWGNPSILARLRNANDFDGAEAALTKMNNGVPPTDFVLASIQSVAKPTNPMGNQAVASQGVRVGNDNGQRHTLHRIFMSFTLSVAMYTESRNSCLDWIAQILMRPTWSGQISLDALSLPVSVISGTDFSWTDPTTTGSSESFLDRKYSASVSATVNVDAALVSRATLVKSWQIETGPIDSDTNLVKIFTNANWKGI